MVAQVEPWSRSCNFLFLDRGQRLGVAQVEPCRRSCNNLLLLDWGQRLGGGTSRAPGARVELLATKPLRQSQGQKCFQIQVRICNCYTRKRKKHIFLLKVSPNYGEWEFFFRIIKRNGQNIPHIFFACSSKTLQLFTRKKSNFTILSMLTNNPW